jgi:uncharacterized protein YbbC (DUF1343 family)
MPSVETAVLYPGMGLLEATNLSEGRGTLQPFRIMGAPWLNNTRVIEGMNWYGLPGIKLEPCEFVPKDIPGVATNSKYKGEKCNGIKMFVVDPVKFHAVEFVVSLLHTIQKIHPEKLEINQTRMNRMAGVNSLYLDLVSGKSTQELKDDFGVGLEEFMKLREKYLLY